MDCDRKHKRTKYETERPQGKCTGEMIDVTSADGSRVYGKRCNVCGFVLQQCEGCGRLYVNLGVHIEKDGACYKPNQMFRTAMAVKNIGKHE
jgi:hypothetical protein